MNYKVYKKNGYLEIQEITGGLKYSALLTDVLILQHDTSKERFWFENVPNFSELVDLSQIKKENGDAYTLSEFVDFYTALPSVSGGGGATEAKQDVGNTYLANIDTKTPALVAGKIPVNTGLNQPLTNQELRTNAILVLPQMQSGGNLIVVTNSIAGVTFMPFASQICKQLTIANDTGTTIEIVQPLISNTAFPILNGSYYTIFGINNTSLISVRRKDQSNTPVTVSARWEV